MSEAKELEWKLSAIVRWLEANQPDVFTRGLWGAIAEAEPPVAIITDVHGSGGFVDWVPEGPDEACEIGQKLYRHPAATASEIAAAERARIIEWLRARAGRMYSSRSAYHEFHALCEAADELFLSGETH